MCGIAGISCLPGFKPSEEALEKMSQALFHRGPDGGGRFDSSSAALRHRRLSIVDIEGGAQPFLYQNGALVANGEIYNDPEIREQFSDSSFSSHSDCEPPLHLMLKDGVGYTHALRGMYAIAALKDEKEQHELLLSRDPFGIKPLYFAHYDEGIAFASEAQALLVAGFGQREVRAQARNELLQLQFTVGQETIFPGIRRLLPGETIRIVNGKIVENYRRKATSEAKKFVGPMSDQQALQELDKALLDSVHAHLRADVPRGLFLSGGIDSSAILVAGHKLGLTHPRTWTARFDAGSNDETEAAAALAASVGAEHHVFTITEQMVWDNLPAIVACMDDPVADYAIIPTWLLAREARKAVTVILSGEGGDELFAGYGRYRRALKPWWKGGRKTWKTGTFGATFPKKERQWREGLARKGFSQKTSRLNAVQALDIEEWLPNDLLLKLDRCLMAHSLEGRTPLLDPVIAKAVWSLPDQFKIRGKYGKWLLRQWLALNAPHSNPFAEKKGFTVPIGVWIEKKAAQLAPFVARHPSLKGVMTEQDITQVFERASQRRYGRQAWSLLFYVLWFRHHVEGVPVEGDTFDVLSCAV
ncbi:asparagine synthase (glutamine-hydrolyzing) [Swingsia samuiensis]|uniref:asparagine synthase (glutamine-hydrolyzing) n=1 Tax=Swingsia samuiensis TaxID=1293412 RepID=A0A4Y6UMQ3_9PROT|nr:asparagine synthase (glutamine-hydrolyzing) [Swingsia samuiensis]QDH17637.1 asparagine synthase (glutamine-hydrolyzing) [Swingsia samuiensis]